MTKKERVFFHVVSSAQGHVVGICLSADEAHTLVGRLRAGGATQFDSRPWVAMNQDDKHDLDAKERNAKLAGYEEGWRDAVAAAARFIATVGDAQWAKEDKAGSSAIHGARMEMVAALSVPGKASR